MVTASSPVSLSLVTDQVFARLRDEIVNGQLSAGDRLRIRDIAARLGTSAMPVREAIQRLEEAGLANRVPHRGAVVRGADLTDLLHIYEIRLVLEVEAARAGAAVVTEPAVTSMAAALGAMREAVNQGNAIEALDQDEQLLRSLYTAQPNRHLVEIIEKLWRQCRVFKIVGAEAAQRTRDLTLWTYQGRLLQAARTQDAEAAVEVTRESLLSARERIQRQLSSLGQPAADGHLAAVENQHLPDNPSLTARGRTT